jgi:hypothetical protein
VIGVIIGYQNPKGGEPMREAVAPILRPSVQPTLETIRKRFQIWRKNGRAGHRIPEALWEEAVRLCRGHSVSKVSRVLRLDYYGLRKRAHQIEDAGSGSDLGFVKLALDPPLVSAPEWKVEMEALSGAKMTLSIKGDPGDWVELSRVFWSQGR